MFDCFTFANAQSSVLVPDFHMAVLVSYLYEAVLDLYEAVFVFTLIAIMQIQFF